MKEIKVELDEALGLWVVKKGKWRVGNKVFRDKKQAENFKKEIEKGKK